VSQSSTGVINALRMAVSYALFMRIFGSVWFLLLALFVGGGLVVTWPTLPWQQAVSRICLCVFYLVLWVLIVIRSPPIAEARGVSPRLAAFVGTYLPWSITFFGNTADAVWHLLSSICVVGGTLLMLLTISHLGKSFSLAPQARTIVRTGPYRWIRHPLYLGEEIAILGTVLQVFAPVTVAIFFIHLAVQMCRIFYEERLLQQVLPAYASYGRAAPWRLVPYVW
jgi:protein-S-isoprenylcysteine O-methyltransferase Ste14